jgi:hypothetical protein
MEGRWVCPRRRGGRVRSLSTITIAADNFNAIGVSCGTLVRTIAKAVFCSISCLLVVGRQAVSVSSSTNNNLHLSKANIYAKRIKQTCCTWSHLRSGIQTNADWSHTSQPQQRQSQETHHDEAASLCAMRHTDVFQ